MKMRNAKYKMKSEKWKINESTNLIIYNLNFSFSRSELWSH